MASDMLWTWRNAQEGSIPHVPLPQSSDGGGSERASLRVAPSIQTHAALVFLCLLHGADADLNMMDLA